VASQQDSASRQERGGQYLRGLSMNNLRCGG